MSSNAQEQHGDDHPIVGHLVPMSILVWTTVALLFLTFVTVAVRYVDVGEFNIVIAIGIAVLKATLVALFFMHLKWDRPFNQIVFVACMAFVILLIVLTVIDTGQNKSFRFDGNPSLVQDTLDAKAPLAPISQETGISSPNS